MKLLSNLQHVDNASTDTRWLICHCKDIVIEKFGLVEAMLKGLARIVEKCGESPRPS